MLQTKEQHKSLETNLNEKEISGLIDMKFKVIKMLIEVRKDINKIIISTKIKKMFLTVPNRNYRVKE